MKVTLLTMIVCSMICAFAAVSSAEKGASLDLAALAAESIGNRSTAAADTAVQRIERIQANDALILKPIEIILPGQFAYIVFKGKQADWSGYDTLELEVACEGEGQLDIMLYEQDKGRQEAWNIRVENLQPGDHSLSFVLAPAPAGALNLAVSEDGVWNPDGTGDVQIMFTDYPRGLEIKALKLTSSTPEVQ